MSNLLRLSGVTLPGDGYPKLSDFVPLILPVATGLVGLFRYGSSLEQSQRNLADASQPLTAIGSPKINDVGASLDNANCFQTAMKSTSAMTIISVARMIHVTANNAGAALVSNHIQEGAVVRGDNLYISGTTAPERRVSLTVGHDGGSSAAHCAPLGTIAGEWNVFVGRITDAAEAQTGHARAGLAVTWGAQTDVGTRNISSTRNLRIGGAYFILGGSTDHALTAIFDRALSTAEIEQNVAYLRSVWGPAIGITTL